MTRAHLVESTVTQLDHLAMRMGLPAYTLLLNLLKAIDAENQFDLHGTESESWESTKRDARLVLDQCERLYV